MYRLRYYLSKETKLTIVTTYILSKMDYCNSLLAGITGELMDKIQKLINASVRFICNLKRRSHITEHAKQLHILPAKERILYKLSIIAFKILNGQSPDYLRSMISIKDIRRTNLRSEDDYFMLEPMKPDNTIAYRITSSWNNLSYDTRSVNNIDEFKKKLKTVYYNIAYPEF